MTGRRSSHLPQKGGAADPRLLLRYLKVAVVDSDVGFARLTLPCSLCTPHLAGGGGFGTKSGPAECEAHNFEEKV